MNLKAISRNVGFALLVSALFMLLSVVVSLLNGRDSAFGPLLISFLITFIVGGFPFIFVRTTQQITLKDGYLIIVISWLLSFIFGMLPYALWGGPFTLSNAWFESVSGFTTSGATILEDIESLPHGLLFWRSSTHFIGGLGVVVFLLLIIPNSSPMKLRLTNMELSSLSKGGYSSNTNKTSYIFAYTYIAIAVVAFAAYLCAGMSPFDAVCHAFSVCATGGFSTKNLSIAGFGSTAVEVITFVLMIVASTHFGLIYLTFAGRSLRPLNNPVLKFYLSALLAVSLLAGFSLKLLGVEPSLGTALWHGAFQTVCIASTTGFAIVDNAAWPLLPSLLILMSGVMCGCAGSTTGGVKADRVLVFFKAIGRQIARILHPSSVNEVRLGGRVLRDEEVSPHVFYLALYLVLTGFSVLAAKALGVNDHNAFAGSVASLGNLGPAIGELGTFGNYSMLPVGAKLLFSLDMFLGRVEIYPVLAVVAMVFDGRKK